MKDLVIDASVIAKWFFEEENTDLAIKIRDHYYNGELELYSPDLVIYELTNVFRYGKIDENLAKDYIQDFYKVEIILIQPTRGLITDTLNLALNYNITIYDGIYLIIARKLGTKTVTADKKLYEKTKSSDLSIYLEHFNIEAL